MTLEKGKKRGTLETLETPSLSTPLGTMLVSNVIIQKRIH